MHMCKLAIICLLNYIVISSFSAVKFGTRRKTLHSKQTNENSENGFYTQSKNNFDERGSYIGPHKVNGNDLLF